MIKSNNILLLNVIIFLFNLTILASNSYSNNLTITEALISESNTLSKTAKITFNVSWENSWRNQVNYDAAWVFVKASNDGGASWRHVTLSGTGKNPLGFSVGTGTAVEILIPSDKKGCFIQRSGLGQGDVEVTGVELLWNWGDDNFTPDDTVRVKVVGIEMVYISGGSFYAGDGDGSAESVYALHQEGADNLSVLIDTNVKSVTCDTNLTDDIDATPISMSGNNGIVGNSYYPTGYYAFYSMKYELSENQWIDFFNTLSADAKLDRDITGPFGKNTDSPLNRNTVSWETGNASTARGDRACSFLSWMDLCAYADWAALRPMTELEYEKICRGTNVSTVGEYAWGDSSIVAAAAIAGTEDGTETITTSGANSCYNDQTFVGGDASSGPLRNGIFATSISSRSQAGAGFYGVMDLTGNLSERVVSLGNSYGRSFQGTHGDGQLAIEEGYDGNATNSDWPGIDSTITNGITSAQGSGVRGGSWQTTTSATLAVSDRSQMATDTSRSAVLGGRCVRTAP